MPSPVAPLVLAAAVAASPALAPGLVVPAAAVRSPPPPAAPSAPAGGPSPLPSRGGVAARGGWSWPLTPAPRVRRGYDAPAQRWAPGHRGVDLDAVAGASVLAPEAGVVAFVGVVAGRPVVSVDHAGGLRTTYEPVTAAVSVGDRLERGQRLGAVASGAGHCGPSACLHWGVRRGRDYVDPLTLVAGRSPVLLPLR